MRKLLFTICLSLGIAVNAFAATTTITQTTAGNYTWTCPDGVTSIAVTARAGGGGTGGLTNDTNKSIGGGAGGQYSYDASFAVTPGTTYNYTVGAAGTAGSATGPTNGGQGGNTWFSSNGSSGVVAVGGLGSLANSATGRLGTTSGGYGDTIIAGGNGANGSGNVGGGGGEGAPTSGTAGNASGATGGTGTNGGDGGNGGTNAQGTAGTAPGGGGGGSGTTSTTNRAGRAGGAGSISFSYTEPTVLDRTKTKLLAHFNGATTTFGNTSVGTDTSNSISGNNAFVQKFNLPVAGAISKITYYSNDDSGTADVKGLIYDDDGASAEPGTLLGVTTATTYDTTPGWKDLVFSTPVVLPAGNYYIGATASTAKSILYLLTSGSTAPLRYKTSNNYASPTTPWGTSNYSADLYQTSIYATYIPTSYTSDDATGRTATFAGSAQLSTAQKAFGTASLLLASATSDYLTFPDSDDWAFGTGDFEIGARVRLSSSPSSAAYTVVSQGVDYDNRWALRRLTDGTWGFGVVSGGSTIISISGSSTVNTGTWYSIAISRSGNNFYLFQDGVLIGSGTDTDAVPNLATPLNIGSTGAFDYFLDGYVDELYIYTGGVLHTATYEPITEEYSLSAAGATNNGNFFLLFD